MARATGKDNDMNVKGQIAEAMWIAESVRAFRYSAEQQAHEDQRGNFVPLRRPLDTSRNLFPKMYPRLIEIVQMLGSSSLMATPSEADLSNDIADDISQYFQTINLESRDRIALFRLAHDVAVSGFGSRQAAVVVQGSTEIEQDGANHRSHSLSKFIEASLAYR